jgi:hypothetical protein
MPPELLSGSLLLAVQGVEDGDRGGQARDQPLGHVQLALRRPRRPEDVCGAGSVPPSDGLRPVLGQLRAQGAAPGGDSPSAAAVRPAFAMVLAPTPFWSRTRSRLANEQADGTDQVRADRREVDG